MIEDFKWSLTGYWTVVGDGICYVAAGTHSDASVTNPVRFFGFATGRTLDVGTLTGSIEDWVGGMTVSPDRRTIVYSHRTYKSSEIVVIDNFR